MAKYHIDRLKKKYSDWTGQKYRDLMGDIIAHNTWQVAQTVVRTTDEKFKEIAKKTMQKQSKKIFLPALTQIIPDKKIHFRKAATEGHIIIDSVREDLSKKLREVLQKPELLKLRGRHAGRLNPEVVNALQQTITETFENYTKKNPRYGMPSNVHTIAVTEIRSAVNGMKKAYISGVMIRNPNLDVTKTWLHNNIAKKPRQGHLSLNGITVGVHEKFKVEREDSSGFDFMDHPHSDDAPPEQVIGCNCDIDYRFEKKPITVDMSVEKAAKVQIGETITRPDGTKWTKTSTFGYTKVVDGGTNTPKAPDAQEKPKETPTKPSVGIMTADQAHEIMMKRGDKGVFSMTKDGLNNYLTEHGLDPKAMNYKDKLIAAQKIAKEKNIDIAKPAEITKEIQKNYESVGLKNQHLFAENDYDEALNGNHSEDNSKHKKIANALQYWQGGAQLNYRNIEQQIFSGVKPEDLTMSGGNTISGNPHREKEIERYKLLVDMMQNAPKYQGEVSRKTFLSPDTLNKLTNSGEYELRAMSGFSAKGGNYSDMPHRTDGKIPVKLRIKNSTQGVAIWSNGRSEHPEEKEVIIPKMKFKVNMSNENHKEDGLEYKIIDLEEIPSNKNIKKSIEKSKNKNWEDELNGIFNLPLSSKI